MESACSHAHAPSTGGRQLVIPLGAFVVYLVARILDWTTRNQWVPTALYVAAASITALTIGRDVVASVRRRRFDIELLMWVAAAGAAVLGHWSDAALLLVLFSLGHGLEAFAMHRARRSIEALGDLAPNVAHRKRRLSSQVDRVAIDDLAAGDVILVRPHERVPADGVVEAGTTSIDESSVTGESTLVSKWAITGGNVDDFDTLPAEHRVFSGTLNGPGAIDVRVLRAAGDSTLARIVQLVTDAETQVSPSQLLARRIVRVFVPAVLALVGLLLVVPPLLGEPFGEAFLRAMSVLVAASPCALAIATPSAVLAAIASAARSGVLVKGGGPLELLGNVTTIAFDKTGTLTEGRPRLVAVKPAPGVTERELLAAACAVERHSSHPVARAITSDAFTRVADLDVPDARDVFEVTGRGVTGTVESAAIEVGNVAFFGGAVPATVLDVQARLTRGGITTMIVRSNGNFLGVLGVMDAPRTEALDALQQLSALGIRRTIVLSGDQQPVVDAVATYVGIGEAHGHLMPADKVAAVRRLATTRGGVAMVGDGVNDAPALATATVGIAMGAAGSAVALEAADIALMADRIDRLPFAVGLARRASRTIRHNLLFSLGVVAVLVPLTIAGVGMAPAVIAHEGSTLVVVVNALLLLRHRPSDADFGRDRADVRALALA